ncbi:DUF4391 domain-containing protein [Halocynthiibacter styelae]|uniref:DUF4391 domain-containing protein n=1 Tax=Halocynthiibacter styelae TaxID=2761955 RepID=A0A8J7LJJ9_9RHOB|nr:DUF4391 domain-containing protein [Paenihalocynthiibacter styelae]MBI1492440.1 DUF4391 domain-containing protein [Paenihalocynthiibacter styelae]
MTALYDYPKTALLKRVVPKTRIYERVQATTALKDKFVAQVDQITWRVKLAPETINLPATKSVPEIQIFRVALKTDTVQDDVLKAIDRAIPFPIVFELEYDQKNQVAAAHKRPSEAETDKWVISDYLRSNWLPADVPRTTLPVALNLGVLYEQILTALMPIVPQTAESLGARMDRAHALKTKEREISQLKSKLKRETQFNIKMTLHGQLREAQADFEHLKKPE